MNVIVHGNAEHLSEAVLYARQVFYRHTLVESAGLFWLLAEFLILFAVLAGRRYLETDPVSRTFRWTGRDTQRALTLGVLFGVLAVFTYGRHVFLLPVHAFLLVQPDAADAAFLDAVAQMTRQRNGEHLVLWAAFVTGWVVLEVLIVYHGWRGHLLLRRLLDSSSPPSGGFTGNSRGGAVVVAGLLAFLLVPVAGAVTALQADNGLVQTMRAAYAAQTGYRDALYLYLRLAGVVWILVEWGAAVILWRAYRLLTDKVARMGERE